MSKKLMLIAAAIVSLSVCAMAQGNGAPAAAPTGSEQPATPKPAMKRKAKRVAKKVAKAKKAKAESAAPAAAPAATPAN